MSKKKLKYKYIPAKSISYGSTRNLATVKYIVIHYTGNKGDTARGNGLYFKNSNTRQAGAHWFVDQGGNIVLSIPMDKTAWSVGGVFDKIEGGSKYYQICVNANSVSIELCDLTSGEPSQAMKDAVRDLVAYIQSQCPNAKTIIRHYDVNSKCCPATMIGKNNKSWEKFKAYISNKEPEGTKTTVIKNGILYSKNDSKSKQIMKVAKGDVWYIQSDNGEGWSYVTDGINAGYVKNKLLADGSLSKFPVKSLIENAALFADNSRECPIGSITRGEVVEVISHRSVWTEVIHDGQKGWVKTAKINFD